MTELYVHPERVVYETIDGETLLIHLASGTYFSLRESGAEIWELLVDEGCTERAVAALIERHPAQAAAVAAEVERLAGELVGHDLLIEGRGSRVPATGTARPATTRAADFVAPILEIYTDMQYFLMLDPIHDVDETAGWPAPGEQRSAAT